MKKRFSSCQTSVGCETFFQFLYKEVQPEWQKLATIRRAQKWPQKFLSDAYLYHVIGHFLPKKRCFWPDRALFCPQSSKKCVNRDKSSIRVQTFRRRPFVPSHNFCHPGYNYILPAKVKQSWCQSPGQRIRDACRKSCVSPHCYLDWCKDSRIRAFWTLHRFHKFLIYLFQPSLGGSQYHFCHWSSVNFKFCNIWPIECSS